MKKQGRNLTFVLITAAIAMLLCFSCVSALAECTHENVYANYDWDEESAPVFLSSHYHVINGKGTVTLTCSDCGEVVSKYKTDLRHVESHEYDEYAKACLTCGHPVPCSHGITSERIECDVFNLKDNGDGKTHTKVYDDVRIYLTCDICGRDLSVKELETYSCKESHFFSDGTTCDCGFINPSPCTHENTHRETMPDDTLPDASITPLDYTFHIVKSRSSVITVCEDCGETLEVYETAVQESAPLPHNFSGGICSECGFVNPCSHPSTYLLSYFDSGMFGEPEYSGITPFTHTTHGILYVIERCAECSEVISSRCIGDTVRTEPHRYVYNYCSDCGFIPAQCAHAHTETIYSIHDNKAVYTPVDDKIHRKSGPAWALTRCTDCGYVDPNVSYEHTVEGSMEEEHVMENGKCLFCGYSSAPVTGADLTGDNAVNGIDAIRLMKYLAGETDPQTGKPYEIDPEAADLNGDGKVDVLDLQLLLDHLAGAEV